MRITRKAVLFISAGAVVAFGIGLVVVLLVSDRENDFIFSWRVPCIFQVEEAILKSGVEIKMRHTLSLEEKDQDLELTWVNTKYLSINGEKANSPEMKKATEPARSLYKSLPPLRISRSGRFLGAAKMKESIEAANKIVDTINTNRTQESREKFARAMTDSQALAVYEGILSQYWSTWVENWIGFPAQPDKPFRAKTKVRINTSLVTADVVFTNAGRVKSNTNLLHLSYEESSDGPELSFALGNMINGLDRKFKGTADDSTGRISITSREAKFDVITNPKTLGPEIARRTVILSMESPEEGKIEAREVYRYEFVWHDTRMQRKIGQKP